MTEKDNAAAKSVEYEIVAKIRPDIAGTFAVGADLAEAVKMQATDEEKQRIVEMLVPLADPALDDHRGRHHREFLRALGDTRFEEQSGTQHRSVGDTSLELAAAAKSVEHQVVVKIRPDIAGTLSLDADLAEAVKAKATDEEKQRIVEKLLPRVDPALGDPRGAHHREFLRVLGVTDYK